MQNRIDKLANLSTMELQKCGLAALIATIESDNVDDEVKEEAIKKLPEVMLLLGTSKEAFDEMYDNVLENFIEELGNDDFLKEWCECEDDCAECDCAECDCIGKDCECHGYSC